MAGKESDFSKRAVEMLCGALNVKVSGGKIALEDVPRVSMVMTLVPMVMSSERKKQEAAKASKER